MGNQAAIDALEQRLADYERKANSIVEVINDLRKEDGLPPRGPFGGGGDATRARAGNHTVTQIKSDTFYGKKLQTAVREYLEMRKIQNLGPATPREIYDAITQGGFKFEAKDANTSMIGMRALLRKRTAFFHRLPNNTYGLTSWYPDLKKQKPAAAGDDEVEQEEEEEAESTQSDAEPEKPSIFPKRSKYS
jgi:hypothetical protein